MTVRDDKAIEILVAADGLFRNPSILLLPRNDLYVLPDRADDFARELPVPFGLLDLNADKMGQDNHVTFRITVKT